MGWKVSDGGGGGGGGDGDEDGRVRRGGMEMGKGRGDGWANERRARAFIVYMSPKVVFS